MSEEFYAVSKEPQVERRVRNSYLIGFLLSTLFTLTAYFLVDKKILQGFELKASLVGLGLLQLAAQLVFFFHLGRESKPRWNFLLFLFMGLVLAILVFGSLWIMHHLNYRMMSMEEMDRHMLWENSR